MFFSSRPNLKHRAASYAIIQVFLEFEVVKFDFILASTVYICMLNVFNV